MAQQGDVRELTSSALFRVLVERSSDGLSLHDRDGHFRYASPAFAQLVGGDPDDLLGANVYDLFHPDDLADFADAHATVLREASAYTVEYRLRRADGTFLWVESSASPVDHPSGRQMVLTTRDIEVRRSAYNTVEYERSLRERLAQLDRERDAFLKAVAHEARTPLTSVSGFARMLRARPDLSDDEHAHITERLVANVDRLLRLVEEITTSETLSRRAMRLERRPVDLAELVRETVARLGTADSVISVTVDHAPVVFADRDRLSLALRALLMNAIVHTPVGTPVRVSARPHPAGAVLVVEDEGPGIADELKPKVFEPFGQANVREHSPGIGLGLHVVRGVAESHGGRAYLEDRPGGGSRFAMVLPDRHTEPAATGPDATTRRLTSVSNG